MRSRTNDIFSIENLRKKWERTGEEEGEQDAVHAEPHPEKPDTIREFGQLRDLVARRFGGEQCEVLNSLLDELGNLLEKRFPETGDTVESEADVSNPAIGEILVQIEDLAEAFSLGTES